MDEGSNTPKLSISSLLVLAAVAIAPWLFATAFSQFEHVKWIAAGVLVAGAIVVTAVRVLTRRPVALVAGPVGTAALAFGIFAAAGVLWNDVPMFGATQGVTWVVFVATFLLLLGPVGRAVRFIEIALALAVATGISGLLGILDLAGVSVFSVVWDPVGPTGAFDSAEVASAFYAVTVPVLLAAAVRHGGKMRGIFAGAAAVGAFHFGLVASPHALWAAGLSVLVASVLMVVLQGFGRAVLLYPAFGAFVVAGVVAGVGALAVSEEGMSSDANRLPLVVSEQKQSMQTIREAKIRNPHFAIGRIERMSSLEAYPYAAGVAFDLFREKPVFGWGTGAWWIEQTRYPRADETFVRQLFDYYPAFKSPHNGYLKTAAELGGLGLILLLFWLVGVASITLTALASKEELENWAIEHWGLLSAALSGAVFAMLTSSFESVAAGLVFFAVLAMLTRESAILNDFKGMSAVWSFNADGKRRLDVTLFGGVVPILIGVAMLYPIAVFGLSAFHRGHADHLMLRTKLTDADAAYQKAHEVFPYDGEVPYNRALISSRKGELKATADLLNEAEKLRPNDARILVLQAQRLVLESQAETALEKARLATRLFPNYVDAYKVTALAYDLNKRYGEAADVTLELLKREPPVPIRGPLHLELSNYYKESKPQLSLEHLTKAAELIEDPVKRQTLEIRVVETEKEIQRERLMREGKPIPPSLMPAKDPHDHGHPKQPSAQDGLPSKPAHDH